MKKLHVLMAVAFMLVTPSAVVLAQLGNATSSAAVGGGRLGILMSNILGFINTVLIPFILGVAFLVFVWGMFQYFILGGDNDEAKGKGKSLIGYSIAGFLLIFVFWGIINVLVNFLGLKESLNTSNLPTTPDITLPR